MEGTWLKLVIGLKPDVDDICPRTEQSFTFYLSTGARGSRPRTEVFVRGCAPERARGGRGGTGVEDMVDASSGGTFSPPKQ